MTAIDGEPAKRRTRRRWSCTSTTWVRRSTFRRGGAGRRVSRRRISRQPSEMWTGVWVVPMDAQPGRLSYTVTATDRSDVRPLSPVHQRRPSADDRRIGTTKADGSTKLTKGFFVFFVLVAKRPSVPYIFHHNHRAYRYRRPAARYAQLWRSAGPTRRCDG
jgi:hypothetical protein